MHDLAVVMPVYNEEGCIKNTVDSWIAVLSELEIKFLIILLNDGSRDGTWDILVTFAGDERIEVINKKNDGHGPTILLGYDKAVRVAEWVFQCDSDNEIKARDFYKFWKERDNYAALFGVRQNRPQHFSRWLVSRVSSLIVNCLFGRSVVDVNVPYRLLKTEVLKLFLHEIPANSFAPNVIISGAFVKLRLPVLNIPVKYQYRKTGEVSIHKWKLVKAAIISFYQTLYFSLKLRIKR